MAKLDGVKLIDVQDGEVKKISYEGSAYVAICDSPEMGDIVRSPGVWDAEEGAFYKVVTRDGFGDNAIIDDVGDKRSGLNTFDIFRKVAGTEVSSLDERVTVLENRVDKIEGNDAEKLEVGEYAKVVGDTLLGEVNPGAFVEIESEKDFAGDYRIRLMDGSDYDYANPEALEKVDLSDEDIKLIKLGRKPGEYKSGDIIKVTETFGVLKIDIGDLAEVKKRGPSKGTIYMKGSPSYILAGELVAPVESRVDIEWRECV